MQAKDIPDDAIIAVLARLERDGKWPGVPRRWVMVWELYEAFPDVPPKVVVAKMRALIRRGIADGCTCGCRGDFELVQPTG